MIRILLFVLLAMTISIADADAFTLSFNDLSIGTDVLTSYELAHDVTFTAGLHVVSPGAYSSEIPNNGAEISGGTIVTMSVTQGIPGLSFYYNGMAELKAYDLAGIVFFDQALPSASMPWEPYAAFFSAPAYKVDFIVPLGCTFHLDPLDTSGGAVIPEPSTIILLGAGLAGLAGLRFRRRMSSRV
ncbi:MAG: PEP-CTERM sorting domain-containing protein [Nitrospirales bacterium]|nr:PEP-CTERM sorting domain-containing protein [Nitrospirales bacterium]